MNENHKYKPDTNRIPLQNSELDLVRRTSEGWLDRQRIGWRKDDFRRRREQRYDATSTLPAVWRVVLEPERMIFRKRHAFKLSVRRSHSIIANRRVPIAPENVSNVRILLSGKLAAVVSEDRLRSEDRLDPIVLIWTDADAIE